MKSTGIVRKIDCLGRIVLPIAFRESLGMKEEAPMEIFVEDEQIVLRKYQKNETCIITGEVSDQNMILSGGIVLSPQGARILQEELLALRLKGEI
ncbi:AbrB/MazE/SpoVT family DNA-binding domain-containing protein [Bacillus subtilis]|uniref:AbrB/MazE/SpoVT family DNA-binding domain-containing protein n=1 Tax=Bacillus subtilis TaxID=1423 RepID=UPI0025576BE6|nr:AbrB/MazE/SpoVT family DNA-binding domain-containing protein [Bacillus subtilis]MDL2030540.1 AbrB/MazE/SpoVT family DNA-binding domain-containing protein [Bacillus subtilis]